MRAFLKRLAKLASPVDRRRYFARCRLEAERRRLAVLPRFQPGTTFLEGETVHFADAASFLSASVEIFDREIYRLPEPGPAPFVIDAGANIGLAILYLKKRHPGARVVAFEPDPGIAAVLKRNLAAWRLDDVELVEKALGAAAGRTAFASEGADGGRVGASVDGARMVEVETVPLAPWLDRPVDFLKIDVEGAETEVLEAARGALGGVRRIFVEYHSFAGEPQKLARLTGLLQEAGFRLHVHPCLTSPRPFEWVRVMAGMDLQLNLFGWREAGPGGPR